MILCLSLQCLSQNTSAAQELLFKKPSVTVVRLTYQSRSIPFDVKLLQTNELFERIDIDQQTLNADIKIGNSTEVIDVSELNPRIHNTDILIPEAEKRKKLIASSLKDNKIGNKILLKIFLDDSNNFDAQKIVDRGSMSKTYDDILRQNHKKFATIHSEDFSEGIKHLNKTYLIGLNQTGLGYIPNNEGDETFYGSGYFFIAKLNFSEHSEGIRQVVLNDSKALKNYIESLTISWEVVYESSAAGEVSQKALLEFHPSDNPIVDMFRKPYVKILNKRRATIRQPKDTLLLRLPTAILASKINSAINAVGDFKPSATVFKVLPIRIKVGTKENLIKGQRWEVMEQVREQSTITMKHVGFIRAKKIVNNNGMASGTIKPSTFYQVEGARIKQGMLARLNDDKHFSFGATYYFKLRALEFTSPHILEFNLSWVFPQISPHLKAGFLLQSDYDSRFNFEYGFITSLGFYASKGISIGRNSVLEIKIPCVVRMPDDKLSLDDYSTWAFAPSASLVRVVNRNSTINLDYGFRYALYNDIFESTPFLGFGYKRAF
jgi:hypothetical protein